MSLAVLIIGKSGIPVLLIGFVLQGLGRAFASGSLDELVIETCMETGGDAAIAKISGELSVLDCAGIAVGSILGGILGGFGKGYSANLISMLAIYAVITILTAAVVKENCGSKNRQREKQKSEKKRKSETFFGQMRKSLCFSCHTVSVRMLMILVFFTGITLFSVETYWQLGFRALLKEEKMYLFGMVSFLGFLLTALSSQVSSRILQRVSGKGERWWWYALFASKLLFGAATALLGMWLHPALFVCGYGFVYFIHGGEGVIENALLSKHTSNEIRAGVL